MLSDTPLPNSEYISIYNTMHAYPEETMKLFEEINEFMKDNTADLTFDQFIKKLDKLKFYKGNFNIRSKGFESLVSKFNTILELKKDEERELKELDFAPTLALSTAKSKTKKKRNKRKTKDSLESKDSLEFKKSPSDQIFTLIAVSLDFFAHEKVTLFLGENGKFPMPIDAFLTPAVKASIQESFLKTRRDYGYCKRFCINLESLSKLGFSADHFTTHLDLHKTVITSILIDMVIKEKNSYLALINLDNILRTCGKIGFSFDDFVKKDSSHSLINILNRLIKDDTSSKSSELKSNGNLAISCLFGIMLLLFPVYNELSPEEKDMVRESIIMLLNIALPSKDGIRDSTRIDGYACSQLHQILYHMPKNILEPEVKKQLFKAVKAESIAQLEKDIKAHTLKSHENSDEEIIHRFIKDITKGHSSISINKEMIIDYSPVDFCLIRDKLRVIIEVQGPTHYDLDGKLNHYTKRKNSYLLTRRIKKFTTHLINFPTQDAFEFNPRDGKFLSKPSADFLLTSIKGTGLLEPKQEVQAKGKTLLFSATNVHGNTFGILGSESDSASASAYDSAHDSASAYNYDSESDSESEDTPSRNLNKIGFK